MEILIPIFGILVVLVPIVGLTTILTIRFGGKPLIETVAREMRASGMAGGPQNDARIADLSEQVELLTSEIQRMREVQEFDRKLVRGEVANPE